MTNILDMKSKILKTVIFSLMLISLLGSCKGKQVEKISDSIDGQTLSDIEVIYFYGKQRCSSCVAMEKFAKEAVDSVFAEKTKDGTINFKTVDITTPEGEKLADLYEVASSSLYIVNNKPDKPEKVDMTAFGFRYDRSDRQFYKQGIIDQINKFLD